jgi:uncharacterized OB-fold protein
MRSGLNSERPSDVRNMSPSSRSVAPIIAILSNLYSAYMTTETEQSETLWALPNTLIQTARGWAILCGECDSCKALIFPMPPICPTCLGESISTRPIDSQGRLYTYTIVHAARPGWNSPYGLAYVDFPEGVRICGPLDLPVSGKIELDTAVDIGFGVLRKDVSGKEWFSHRFLQAKVDKKNHESEPV